jgi:hypothetical protein
VDQINTEIVQHKELTITIEHSFINIQNVVLDGFCLFFISSFNRKKLKDKNLKFGK